MIADVHDVHDRMAAAMPPAGVASRVGKLVIGAAQLWFVYAVATHLSHILHIAPNGVGFWIFVGWALWLVGPVANIGLIRQRTIGSRTRWWAIAALVVLAAAGQAVLRDWWWLPTAVFTVGVTVLVHLYVGLCHFVSGVTGFPGCELRALAYLVGRLRGRQSTFSTCSGVWTPIDRWEVRLRHRA